LPQSGERLRAPKALCFAQKARSTCRVEGTFSLCDGGILSKALERIPSRNLTEN
jgi:hypothetical protein